MNVLIENAFPLNNGDAALIFALGNALKQKGFNVDYSTSNTEAVREKYGEETWIDSPLNNRLIKIPYLGYLLLLFFVVFSGKYKKYDAVISAPGGYIHSYYSIKRKLQLMTIYKRVLRKKTIMYSLSIGNLSTDDRRNLKKHLPVFDVFYVRDQVSLDRVNELGSFSNVSLTKDAAFLLQPIRGVKNLKTVAISVREWKQEGRDESAYIHLIHKIVKYLIDRGYKITFLSTCQGDIRYTNDSLMASKIVSKLEPELVKNIVVDGQYYNLRQLRDKLTTFEYVIGTRLHMCILAWLSGTPALNISYEEKGRECYEYLDIPQFSIDFNFLSDITVVLDRFLYIYDDKAEETLNLISNIRLENISCLNEVCNLIEE